MKDPNSIELTDEQYWSGVWTANHSAFNHIEPSARICRRYCDFLTEALAGCRGSLMEVGCGASPWLPFLAKHFGFRVAGIDYSEIGCQQASALLSQTGIEGKILPRDALSENLDLMDASTWWFLWT